MSVGTGRQLRYAVFDLDGTLLDEDGAVSEATRRGLARLRDQANLRLVVASGRSPYLVRLLNLSDELLSLFEPVMVLRDGDVRWNWQTDQVLAIRTVPDSVVPVLLTHGFSDLVVDTGRALVASSPHAAVLHAETYRCPRNSVEVVGRPPATPATKVTVYADPAAVRAALAGVTECSFSASSSTPRCSVVPFDSCKGAGLARFMADMYAEPTLERTVAFGDGANDVCMLRSAGAGVAMAVSHAAAIGAATVRLTESLGAYLRRFPHGLALRTASRCLHQA